MQGLSPSEVYLQWDRHGVEQEVDTGVITDANPTPVCSVPEVQPPVPGLGCSYVCACELSGL